MMGRSAVPSKKRKESVSVTPDPDLYEWVKARTGPGKRFATVTHAVELGWAALKAQEDADAKK